MLQCSGHLRPAKSTAPSKYFFLVVMSAYLSEDVELSLLFSFGGLPKHFTISPDKASRLGKMLDINCGKDCPVSILTTGLRKHGF